MINNTVYETKENELLYHCIRINDFLVNFKIANIEKIHSLLLTIVANIYDIDFQVQLKIMYLFTLTAFGNKNIHFPYLKKVFRFLKNLQKCRKNAGFLEIHMKISQQMVTRGMCSGTSFPFKKTSS